MVHRQEQTNGFDHSESYGLQNTIKERQQYRNKEFDDRQLEVAGWPHVHQQKLAGISRRHQEKLSVKKGLKN